MSSRTKLPLQLGMSKRGTPRFKRSIERAETAAREKRWEDALRYLSTALEECPDDAEPLYLKAYVLRRKGDLEAAWTVIEGAQNLHPQDLRILAERGNIAFKLGKAAGGQESRLRHYAAAERLYREVLRRQGDYKEAREGLADVLVATQRLEEGRRLLQALEDEHPQDTRIGLNLGWVLLQQDRPYEALERFRKVAESPESYYAHIGIGAVRFVQQRYADSEEALHRAIDKDPERPDAYIRLAWVLALQKKSLDEAAALCEHARRPGANDSEALHCLGMIHFQKNQACTAEWFFRSAIESDGSNLGARLRLGLLLDHLDDLAGAKAQFDHILDRDDTNDQAYQARGTVLFKQGDLVAALRDFRRANALRPHLPQPLSGIAHTLAEKGKLQEAISLLRAGLKKVRPIDLWRLRATLARLLTQAGEILNDPKLFDEALEEANRGLQQNRGKDLLFLAGIAAAKTGEFSRSVTYLQEALGLDTDDARVQRFLRQVQVARRRRPRWEQALLFVFTFASFAGLWAAFLAGKITGGPFAALLPVLMSMVLIVFFLPRLTRLKLPGFEAELDPVAAVSRPEVQLVSSLGDLSPISQISVLLTD